MGRVMSRVHPTPPPVQRSSDNEFDRIGPEFGKSEPPESGELGCDRISYYITVSIESQNAFLQGFVCFVSAFFFPGDLESLTESWLMDHPVSQGPGTILRYLDPIEV